MDMLPATPPAGAPAVAAPRRPRWHLPLAIVAGIGLVLAAWQGFDTRGDLRRTQEELTRRTAEADTIAKEARAEARRAHEQMLTLQSKIGAIESRVGEAQNQQATLEAMYQEFARARDERALADADHAIGIAVQQLQLAGNVQAALAALQTADARLVMQDRPQFLPLRRALARDIARLQALPLADVTSLALQLETMVGRIEALPLGFEHAPAPTQSAPAAAPKKNETGGGRRGTRSAVVASAPASAPVADTEEPGMLSSLLDDLGRELRQLIRIERLDRPDPALLAPTHAAYLREHIRLRLLSARLALLQRDGKLFAEDLRQTRSWLERYFDVQARPVQAMLVELRQMEAARLQVDMPNLSDSETALRSVKLERR